MPQVTISLKPSEKEALILLADQERRKMQDQAALIIRFELERLGLIEPNAIPCGSINKISQGVKNG